MRMLAAVLVLALAGAAMAALPFTPTHRMRQIERSLVMRFGPIAGRGGARAVAGFAGGVQVRLAIAPAHTRDGQLRAWSDAEARKILGRMRDVLAEFRDVSFLPTSGIELEPVDGGARRALTFGPASPAGARVARAAAVPGQPRAAAMHGAPEAANPSDAGSPAAGASPSAAPADAASPGPGASAGPPAPLPDGAPDASASAAPPSPGPADVGPVPGAPPIAAPPGTPELPATDTTVNVAPRPAVQEGPGAAPGAGHLPDPRSLSSFYPQQPGGYGRGDYPASVAATQPTSVYRYPRDNDALEWMIEREVGVALRSTFKDARVHARVVRPQVVRLDVEVAMTGHFQENLDHILHFTRDTTLTVFREKFNLLRIHYESRIRVTEADDRFSYDFRFMELTPYGHHDRHEENPLFRTITTERTHVIDVPRAFLLGRDVSAIEVGTLSRTIAPGRYSNVSVSTSTAYDLTLRRGFWEGLEASLGYYSYQNRVTPTAAGVLSSSSDGLGAITFGARYRMPYELNGFALTIGFTHAFQPGEDRKFFLPDDFERLYNLYVVGSRRFFEDLLVHVAVKRVSIGEQPDFADTGFNELGVGFEYVVHDQAILMLELVDQQYDNSTVGAFGTLSTSSGLHVNAGAVIGSRLGDVEVSARKIDQDREREVDVSLAYRW